MPDHGVLSHAGTNGRGASFLGFGVASGKIGCPVVGLGVTGLNFWGVAVFLFSVTLSFLMLGLVSGSGGLNWLLGVGIGPILPSTSRKVFIFLMIVGCRWSLVLQDVHLINCVVLSLLKMCPLHRGNLHFYVHYLYKSLHLKKPCKKLHSGWSRHAMSCLKYKYMSIYITSISVSKLYHVIPCFTITCKFSGSWFIILLTLILSCILIVIILGRSILLPFNINLIPFQFISNVSHK